jgi:acetyltransferase
LLPVNPKYKTIHGHESFGSVSALETGVDLAIIATPIDSVAPRRFIIVSSER